MPQHQNDDTLRGAVVKSGVWKALDPEHRSKWKQLSVQWSANKQAVRNRGSKPSQNRGISLEMLEAAGVLGADAADPLCNRFIFEMIEGQSEVVSFVRSLAPLRAQAQQLSAYLHTANAEGKLSQLGESVTGILNFFGALDSGLDVFAHCPALAPEHVEPME
jgi:hypothetical protein